MRVAGESPRARRSSLSAAAASSWACMKAETTPPKVTKPTRNIPLTGRNRRTGRLSALRNTRPPAGGRAARSKSAEEVRQEWDAGNVAVRRAILSRHLQAIVVRKSSVRGPGELDYAAIEPIWKGSRQAVPSAWDHAQ
jgi:hypothetical protein